MLGFAGYALAALAWFALAVLLTVRTRGSGVGRLLLVAVATQIVWAGSLALSITTIPHPSFLASVMEALRNVAWVGFLVGLVLAAAASERVESSPARAIRLAMGLSAMLAIGSVAADLQAAGHQAVFGSKLLAAVFGLVCVEQVYHNAPAAGRWAIKFLFLALVGLFGFDVALYSDALLFGRVDFDWWSARGYANAMLVPLVAVAAARNPQWKLDISVSRRAVFHSTALLASGAYLTAVAAAGYWLRLTGGQWGGVAQTLLLFGALVGLGALATSGTLRARLRVTLAKNFFSYRYDYREEWKKLSALIAPPDAGETDGRSTETLGVRAIRGLASLVESPGGILWLRSERGNYVPDSRWAVANAPPSLTGDDPLVRYLSEREWIIDLQELRQAPARYSRLKVPGWLATEPDAWLFIPLMMHNELLGIAQLQRPLAPAPVDWEVRDVLKAAARQIAGYLAVRQTVEKLVEARQFDSFNRMSAFVVHDLKNLVAQLSLLTRNAARHRDNPDFQRDMLSTVQHVLERMQGLLLQLRVGDRPFEQSAAVPLGPILLAAIHAKHGLRPEPIVNIDATVNDAQVIAHADRLQRVIGHLIQNAAEATPSGGAVNVRARRDGDDALIEVEDTGTGMSREFIETRLFKPFLSTKAHGMGIGAFESREYIRDLGGTLTVRSVEGVGSTFTIRLPLQRASAAVH